MVPYFIVKCPFGVVTDRMAEEYVASLVWEKPALLTALTRVKNILKNSPMEKDGKFSNLVKKSIHGHDYFCIEVDDFIHPITSEKVHQELIKKLNSTANAYEIRIDSGPEHYRIIFVPNVKHKVFLISFGFTKVNGTNNYLPENLNANDLTDFYGKLTDTINKSIKNNINYWLKDEEEKYHEFK